RDRAGLRTLPRTGHARIAHPGHACHRPFTADSGAQCDTARHGQSHRGRLGRTPRLDGDDDRSVGSAPAWRRLPAQSARSAMVPRPAQVRWPGTAVGWRVGSAHLDRVAGAGEAGAVTRAGVSRDYPAIAGHGLIGDLQTLALVSDRGAVNFFCAPRFDSPSVFASLLDADRGGHFTVTVEG